MGGDGYALRVLAAMASGNCEMVTHEWVRECLASQTLVDASSAPGILAHECNLKKGGVCAGMVLAILDHPPGDTDYAPAMTQADGPPPPPAQVLARLFELAGGRRVQCVSCLLTTNRRPR